MKSITVSWPICILGCVALIVVGFLLYTHVITPEQIKSATLPIIGLAWMSPAPFKINGKSTGHTMPPPSK